MTKQKRMVIPGITLILMFAVATGFGADTKSRSENMAKEDSEFVSDAAMGGLMEVQLGNTAQSQGSKSQVKNFGRRMHADHTSQRAAQENRGKEGYQTSKRARGPTKSYLRQTY